MRTIVFSIVLLSGCAGSYRSAYLAGAATKEFVAQAYDLYGAELNRRLDGCDPSTNAAVRTREALDACLGPFFRDADNEKVVAAIASYRAAAAALSAVMLREGATGEEISAAWGAAYDAAVEALMRLPEGAERVRKLASMLPRRR
jgi:hypothetical protein